jgi:hypothetical protein
MCGWVKLYRDVLEKELWKEVAFVLVLIHASREDGITVNGIMLKIGQYTKANTKLAKDLG